MTRSILFALAIGLAGGCATVSGSTTTTDGAYATMHSPPPAPQKEETPRLDAKQVWVPGYYQPVAGTWVWHQGAITDDKEGYKLLPASYRQENGAYTFVPPRWRRADLADSAK